MNSKREYQISDIITILETTRPVANKTRFAQGYEDVIHTVKTCSSKPVVTATLLDIALHQAFVKRFTAPNDFMDGFTYGKDCVLYALERLDSEMG